MRDNRGHDWRRCASAMGLHEALFSVMPNEAWHTGIQPKWAGTWNLHKALEGRDSDLDFFLLTSSVSGSVGTATESNYCAANGFLDAFAQWRRQKGKPAVSVGLGMISEVGYLHENPDVEALLLRKGIQPLNEDEFLQVIDLALAGVGSHSTATQDASRIDVADGHILTGLEAFGIRKLMERGFEVDNGTMQDPRAGLLSAALLAEHDNDRGAVTAKSSQAVAGIIAAPWYKSVSQKIADVFAAEADADSLQSATLRLLRKRFCNLILMPLEQIDDDKPLAQFGIDSMISAEFRTWIWNSFKVDVPFLDLLSPHKSLSTLARFVGLALENNS